MQNQQAKTATVNRGKRKLILLYISIIFFGLMACNSGPETNKPAVEPWWRYRPL